MSANLFVFHGIPRRMQIISNNIGWGLQPEPDKEVEQHLTINEQGRVWFSQYIYGDSGSHGRYQRAKGKQFTVDKTEAEKILSSVAAYFSENDDGLFATDVGDWTMKLTNTDGVIYKFTGSLCPCTKSDIDLSALIRDSLNMDELYVFDGQCRPDVINRITLNYHRHSRFKTKQAAKDNEPEYDIRDYSECLIIDRKTETIEHVQKTSAGCKVSHKYEVEGGIEDLLESFDAEELFTNVAGNPDDVVKTSNETRIYTLTVDYKRAPQRVVTGTFDKYGLPNDFAEFAEKISDFMKSYGPGELLNPSVYGRIKRRKSEYMYCSVIFEKRSRTYYYLTDDDSIDVGDFVIVPAGMDNHQAVAEIVNIEYFSEKNVPLALDKTKHVIRKCMEKKEPGKFHEINPAALL